MNRRLNIIRKAGTILFIVFTALALWFCFMFWLNLQMIRNSFCGDAKSNARNIASADLRSGINKYYILTENDELKDQYILVENNDVQIKVVYYYYKGNYFDFFFVITPEMLSLWYVDGYNSKVKEIFPHINFEQFLLHSSK